MRALRSTYFCRYQHVGESQRYPKIYCALYREQFLSLHSEYHIQFIDQYTTSKTHIILSTVNIFSRFSVHFRYHIYSLLTNILHTKIILYWVQGTLPVAIFVYINAKSPCNRHRTLPGKKSTVIIRVIFVLPCS